MKYSEKIFIPLLCPVQFLEPREQVFYKKQGYIGSIITDIYMQFFIDQTLYLSSTEITLVMKDSISKVVLNTIQLAKQVLLAAPSASYNIPTIAAGTYKLVKSGSTTYVYRGSWDHNTIYALNEAVIFMGILYYTPSSGLTGIPATGAWNRIVGEYVLADNLGAIIPGNGGLYFVEGSIQKGIDTRYVFFELYHGEELLADSISYCLNPYDDRRLKILTYTHYENDYNAVFIFGSNINTFSMAIECGFIPNDFQTKTQIEDFEQQDMMNSLVSARPYCIEPITFGTSKGIPNWLAHKLNIIFLLSNVKIEEEIVVRASGSEMELVERTNNGLGVYKLNLQSFEDNYLPYRIFNMNFNDRFN